ncbi:MAG: type 1 glutamine amidotransferase, partial [Geobacter sp.]
MEPAFSMILTGKRPYMFVIIQNDPKVAPGTLGENLAEEGVAFRVVHPYSGEALPQVSDVSAAIVLGGAMGVHDSARYPFLTDLNCFIREGVRSTTPLLGVCLGGQLVDDALGAAVTANMHGEKGMCSVNISPEGKDDPLFAGLPEEFLSFQWHNDSFAL